MVDISNNLSEIIKDKKCSSLLAFIVIKDGIHIQQSESGKESCRRLRDKGNINTHR